MKSDEEREMIQFNKTEMWLLKDALSIKETKCFYCKKEIKKGDKFSIFNFPTRLICNSELCLSEAIGEDERK